MDDKGIKYKIGNIAYFYNFSNTEYPWKLKKFERCRISNVAFNYSGDVFYAIHNGSSENCWYKESDFLSLFECRKYKLNELNSTTK